MAAAIVSTVAAGALAGTGATASAVDVPPPPAGPAGPAWPVAAPDCSSSEEDAGAPADAGVEATTRPAADPG